MNSMVVYDKDEFETIQRVASAMVKSGYFSDTRDVAQGIVKIMAGKELGLPAFASMSGIHIIQNKPVLGSNVIATLVKNDPRYDYRIKQCDDKACVLEWFENGQSVGEAGFTMQEANNAGLTGKDNWKKYTSDMLFARAISRGARRYAPGIFGGSPVYTPDEMGVDTDEEGYIESPSVTISGPEYKAKVATGDAIVEAVRDSSDLLDYLTEDEPKPAKKGNGKFARPMTPEILKEALETKVAELGEYGATDKQRNLLGSLLSQHFQDDTKRYEASKWLFGAASTKQIDGALVKAALDWLKPEKDDGGAYVIDRDAQAELSSVLTVALQAAGQRAL